MRALARSERAAERISGADEVVIGNVTAPSSLTGLCNGVETVISTIGITHQKDGLTYNDVDYRGNVNLLREAEASGVRKFLYVSVLHAEQMPHLKIVQAKEKFVRALRESRIATVVVRPNGFFSDMREFLNMAARGRIYLFGDGHFRGNPIHGADLARFCVDALSSGQSEHDVGGPAIYTQREIAEAAFRAVGKKIRLMSVPVGVARAIVGALRLATSSKVYGPIEFFVEVLSRDMVGPKYGTESLIDFFEQEARAVGGGIG